MQFLKADTAKILRMGPFVDSGDGVTPETALTIAQADIQISKDGGAFAQTSATSPTTTHDADGWYQIPLTATDTNTEGPLVVQLTMTGALIVWKEFMVVEANVYDSLFSAAGTDYLHVDVLRVNNNFTARVTALADGTGTATAFGTNLDLTYSTDDTFNDRSIIFISGNLNGQAGRITDYNGTTGVVTVASGSFTQAPANNDILIIV